MSPQKIIYQHKEQEELYLIPTLLIHDIEKEELNNTKPVAKVV